MSKDQDLELNKLEWSAHVLGDRKTWTATCLNNEQIATNFELFAFGIRYKKYLDNVRYTKGSVIKILQVNANNYKRRDTNLPNII